MSYSVEVKKELCRLTCQSENEMRAELAGMIMGSYVLAGRRRAGGRHFAITTEFPFLAARMRSVSKKLYGSGLTVSIQTVRKQRVYAVKAESAAFSRRLMKDARIDKEGAGEDIPPYFLSKQHYFKAYLRGLFITCGSVSDPKKKYQLEMSGNSTPFFENVSRILKGYGISCKARSRGDQGVLDFRDSGSIGDFLSLIGAAKAALDMTNVKIVKEMRNDVNRRVNCDVANLQKSAKAAGDQISAIRKIETKAGLGILPKALREVAELRLEHPDASVQELGALMQPPLQKSAMYYRIRKIKKVAETL